MGYPLLSKTIKYECEPGPNAKLLKKMFPGEELLFTITVTGGKSGGNESVLNTGLIFDVL